jgi:hypothetical protein
MVGETAKTKTNACEEHVAVGPDGGTFAICHYAFLFNLL